MKIRRAGIGDSAEIARLHRSTIRSINSKDYPAKDIEAWSRRITAEKERAVFESHIRYVAVEKEKIIGFCDISKEKAEDGWGLYVHKDWIGKGVGSRLMQKIEVIARKRGTKKLKVVSTLTARPFYASKGFKTIGKTIHQIGDRKLDVVVMEKKLRF